MNKPQLSLSSSSSIDTALNYAETLMEKKLVPSTIKSPHHILGIIKIGESLDMDPITALNSIDIIQGAYSIKAKMLAGLLTRNGVSIEVIKDFEPVYEEKIQYITEEDEEGNKMPVMDDEGRLKVYRDYDGSPKTKKKQVDNITTIRFKRHFPNIGVVTNDVSVKWSDAVQAGWTNKPNWQKMPKYMMTARCLARGARLIASDLISGLYTDYETAEFTDANFDVDEDGNLIVDDRNE